LIKSSPFTNYLTFPITESDELASQERLKVGCNFGKYQRLRPSRHNPRTYTYSSLPVSNSKSLSSGIPMHMEKGSFSTVNIRRNPRAHSAKLKVNGESEERGKVTQSDCGKQHLVAYHDSHLCEKYE